MGLETYRKKRDFARTPEPAGGEDLAPGRRYLVQQHAARRMHWDLRLELDGALASWAVPKIPSLDPAVKRLAVRTEDHPLEYGSFEGVIPKGEYGAGTVLLWDRGTWEPIGDPRRGLEKGRLDFNLSGERLRGRFHLVRTRDEKSWLLIKGRDAHAQGAELDEDLPSVASGRSMARIAEAPERVWSSRGALDLTTTTGAQRGAFPRVIQPELATLATSVPEGDAWLHEIKLDGYRILARVEAGRARLFTRKGHDWTDRVGPVARALGALPVERAWLDGEIVVLDAKGRSHFGALQDALARGRAGSIRYFAFDLLYASEWDLRRAALTDRKHALSELFARAGSSDVVRYCDHVRGNGPRFFAEACRMGLEGVVSKRADRPYASRRTRDWLKVKCLAREEAVIVGYTDPSGTRKGLGALLLAQHDRGALRFVGKVGAGFDERALRDLSAKLAGRRVDRPAFTGAPRRTRGVHFVRPELVAEVRFASRTNDGKLRQAVFLGLREDKPSREVRRERPSVRLTSPDKVMYPAAGGAPAITKRELLAHYELVAARMLPHVRGRPLTLVRCPDGIDPKSPSGCFYARHPFQGMPDAIGRVRVKEGGERSEQLVVQRREGLLSLTQIGALEIHVGSASLPRLDRPDRVVFDLDPGAGVPWSGVVEASFAVRERLAALGLESFVKLTGGKGVHIVAPIVRRLAWDEVKAFARAVAVDLARRDGRRFTAVMGKARRKGKVYVDYLRNTERATAVAAYSTRAKPGAPVSVPVRWDELAELRSDAVHVRDMPARLRGEDPWASFFDTRQSITLAMRREVGAL